MSTPWSTIGELKRAIEHLPDEMVLSPTTEDHCYELEFYGDRWGWFYAHGEVMDTKNRPIEFEDGLWRVKTEEPTK